MGDTGLGERERETRLKWAALAEEGQWLYGYKDAVNGKS